MNTAGWVATNAQKCEINFVILFWDISKEKKFRDILQNKSWTRYFSNIFYRRPARLIISGFPAHKKTFGNTIDSEKMPYVSKSSWNHYQEETEKKMHDGQDVNL